METIQIKLQKFSRVVFVFAKIGYIAAIVGVCLCALTFIWTFATGSPFTTVQVGDVTFHSPVIENNLNPAGLYGELSYTITYCAFLIAIMRMLMNLFANIRDQYTPFTMENATLFKHMAIVMIVASIVPAAVGSTVGAICAEMMSLSFDADYGNSFSLIAVLLLFAMSMVFKYGCALQEQADTTL